MKKGNERGAVVVEGILSLTTFMFTIFTILSIVNICYIQAKISVALNTAAKEISQYSFFYYKFGLDKVDAGLAEGTEDSRALADGTIEGMSTLMNSLSSASGSLQTGDFDNMVNQLNSAHGTATDLVDQYADRLSEDPKGFIIGMGKMLGNELAQEGKKLLAQAMAKAFMKKNLKASPEDSAEAFLNRYKVVQGMKGLDFDNTTFLHNGQSDLIQLVVTYKVRVIQLLDIEFDFTFRQCVKTTAWGRGE